MVFSCAFSNVPGSRKSSENTAELSESAGVEVVEVDPKGTSQQCSGCGLMVPKDLWVRTHCCVQCGLVLHRDENAAKNILARALQARTGPVGFNVTVA
jgi:putative transposase